MTPAMYEIIRQGEIGRLQAHYSTLLPDNPQAPNHKPLIVNGQKYPSPAQAAAALHVSEQALREVCRGLRRRIRDRGGKLVQVNARYL